MSDINFVAAQLHCFFSVFFFGSSKKEEKYPVDARAKSQKKTTNNYKFDQ